MILFRIKESIIYKTIDAMQKHLHHKQRRRRAVARPSAVAFWPRVHLLSHTLCPELLVSFTGALYVSYTGARCHTMRVYGTYAITSNSGTSITSTSIYLCLYDNMPYMSTICLL